MSRPGLPWMLVLLLLAGPGCGDDGPGPDTGSLAGRITTLDTRAPLEGARVVLFSPADNVPVGSSALTGLDGKYRIDGISPGFYYAVVYAGRRIAFDSIEQAVDVRSRRTVERNLLVTSYPLLPDGRTVTGVVRDAETGAPLAGAYVSVGSSDFPLLFGGTGLPWETITDDNGRFLLDSVPTVTRGISTVGLVPVVAMKAGYLPAGTGSNFRSDWLPLPGDGDTARVTLNLVRGEGAHSVHGRVRHNGVPVPGVTVALSFSDINTDTLPSEMPSPPTDTGWRMGGRTSGDPVGEPHGRGVPDALRPTALAPDLVAHTDAGGHFEIRHVSPGRYHLQAAYLPDDGWVQVPPQSGLLEVIVRDQSIENAVVDVVPGIEILSPRGGEVVPTARPRFAWRPVPGANQYFVIFSRANSYFLTDRLETTDTTAVAPAGFWGHGDHARWTVLALRDEDIIIAAGETISSFSVVVRR